MLRNVQPLFADFAFGGLAIAHNGNLTNAHRAASPARRGGLALPVDDRHRGHRPPDRQAAGRRPSSAASSTRSASSRAPGRWSACSTAASSACATRWASARWSSAGSTAPTILASETCALDIMGAELRPRRRARRDRGRRARTGVRSLRLCAGPARTASASSSTSTSPGPTAWSRAGASTRSGSGSAPSWRARAGVPADVVVPVPDSGVPAAIGYAQGGRPRRSSSASSATTMSAGPSSSRPTSIRHLGVRLKHNANRPTLAGQARRPGRRQHRARHHLDQDRRHGARRRGRRRSTCGSRARPRPTAASTASTRPSAASSWRPTTRSRRWPRLIGVDSLAFLSIDGLYRAVGEAAPRQRHAAILRRLLHRRLPDPPRRYRGRGAAGPALAAARGRVTADAGLAGRVVLITGASRGPGRRAGGGLRRRGRQARARRPHARRARGGRRPRPRRRRGGDARPARPRRRSSWSTRSAAAVHQRYGRLDGLVGLRRRARGPDPHAAPRPEPSSRASWR